MLLSQQFFRCFGGAMDAVDLQITSADENHDVERSSGGDDQFVKRAGPDVQRHLTAPVSRLRETRGDAQKQLKVRRTTYRLSTAAVSVP
jgi:hypothetical protein